MGTLLATLYYGGNREMNFWQPKHFRSNNGENILQPIKLGGISVLYL